MAMKMLNLLKIDNVEPQMGKVSAIDLFHHNEWGTGSKKKHLSSIAKKYGIGYDEMCLFDDELRNRDVEHDLGVKFIHIASESVGLNYKVFENGLQSWAEFNKKI